LSPQNKRFAAAIKQAIQAKNDRGDPKDIISLATFSRDIAAVMTVKRQAFLQLEKHGPEQIWLYVRLFILHFYVLSYGKSMVCTLKLSKECCTFSHQTQTKAST
jgi:hypothetical protein